MKEFKMELSADSLREILFYDKDSGLFSWKIKKSRRNIGDPAGSSNKGYIFIKINQKVYAASRLAWLYVYGQWPENEMDHIDQCKSNNAISNLRDVIGAINLQNQRKPHKNNSSGFLGVIRRKKRWVARIQLNRKTHWLGTFDTKESAHNAYLNGKKLIHEGCTLYE